MSDSAREDDFVHLHVHTEYSMLDGAARLDDLFAQTAGLGQSAIAMTDHGNLYGAFEFYSKARKAGIKPIIGIEGYYAPQGRFERAPMDFGGGYDEGAGDISEGRGSFAYTHMTMWAENNAGLHNLFRLSSLASIEGQYRAPRFDRELLERYGTGLIGTTGCPSGEVNRWLQAGQYDKALQAAADARDILGGDNYFCELMDHGIDIERRFRDDLLRIAKTLNLPFVATNDTHYVHADDWKMHDAFLCVGTKSLLSDTRRFRFDSHDFYVKTAAQMRDLWRDFPDACDNTLLIAERCDTSFTEDANLMPRFPVPAGESEESWLVKEVERGLTARFAPGPVPPEHRRQAEYEVGVITQMGYPGYFLVVADLVRHAHEQGIRVGPGRGSAAGALIAWALGITELDPLAHGLVFERFLNPERRSMPDIDMDFDERRRGEMIRYATEKYGDDHVAQIVTYGTIKAKAAIKDAARVLGKPFKLSDDITKAMPPAVMGKDIPLAGIFDPGHERHKEAGEFRDLYQSDAEVREVVDLARGLEGLKRQVGVHAAGVILSSERLTDVIPVWRRDADGSIITQFDMGACESLGLLKMDFLGLRTLTVLDDAIAAIRANTGEDLVLEQLPLDNRATYELLARGDTLGVFQLDGGPMRALLRSMAPDSFEDISAVLALYRPGPMGANAHNEYADRKNARKPVIPIHPELAEPLADILDDTYGLCVTGDTLIWDARSGRRVRIDSIRDNVGRGFTTFAIAADGTVVERPVTHWMATGAKRVLTVTTQDGRQLRLSEDHPVLTASGWRKAGELIAGIDRLAVPRTPLQPSAPPGALTPEQGRLLGCLLADGHVPLYQRSLESGLPEVRRLDGWLSEMEFCRKAQGCSKSVPQEVFASANDVLVQVLAGLWDTDGQVGSDSASLTCVSPALAKDVTALLARLGIHSRMSREQGRTGRPGYRVEVDQQAFWDLVVPQLRAPCHRDVARRAATGPLPSLGADDALVLGRTAPIVTDDPRAPAAEYLQRYGTDEDLRYARQSWTMITSVEAGGDEEMYDITVAEFHNFLANDFVVHNCIYQEQVMAIAQKLAGYSLGKADLLRRAMGKKKKSILDQEFVPFRDGMRANGYSDDAIRTLWDILVPFADYAFNKAHTAGYGLVAYWTAYLKANYPAEFMSALLTSVKDDKSTANGPGRLSVYLNECRRMGIKVLPPDINESDANFTARGGDIRFGLSAVRNVGENVVASILATRRAHGRFADFPDFIDAVEIGVCNKRVIESLIKAGSFDSLGHTRKGLVTVHELLVDSAVETKRAEAIGQFDLFGGEDGDPTGATVSVLPEIPLGEWDKTPLLAAEREMLGLYVSDHPLNGVESVLRQSVDCSLASLHLDERPSGQVVTVGGLIASVQRKVTRERGEPWAIVQLEDLDASIEVSVYPRYYAPVSAHLVEDKIALFKVRLERRDEESLRLVALEVSFPDLSHQHVGPVRVNMAAARCVPPVVDRLKEILSAHPGTVEVQLHLQHSGRTTVLRLDDRLRVTPSPALFSDLKALLGPAAVG